MNNTEQQSSFPQALKALRARYGLSQFQLAIKLGKTPSKIAQYESGQRNATRVGIAEIVEALKATPAEHDDLLMAAGFMPDQPDVPTLIEFATRGRFPDDDVDILVARAREIAEREHSRSEERKA
jgi:transcriptional regulator with XRE-family HTH domain